MRRQLAYQQLWRRSGIAAYIRQMCACCGHTAKEKRQSQGQFECECYENTDINRARNILAAGHAGLPVKRGGAERLLTRKPTEAS